MISKIIKTAKFMADWLDWSLLYPLWQTEVGREQIIRTALGVIKKHPEKLEEIQALVEKVMGEEILNAVLRSAQAKKAAPPEKKAASDPTAVEDGDAPPEERPDASRLSEEILGAKRGRPRDISDLKTRLGLKKA